MIRKLISIKRPTAFLMLMIMLTELIVPATVSALTSGPAQPEMTGFSPIGAADMVDPFTGDFSYNIPLMDVGGYPLNLAYTAGANMDDEASWVGYGWSLTPGTVNRQLRGIPDDFNGKDDKITRHMNMRDHVTRGVKGSVSLDILGFPLAGEGTKQAAASVTTKKKKKKLNLTPALNLQIQHDNYKGWGAEIGANLGINLNSITETEQTKDTAISRSILGSLNLGFTSSSTDGVSFNPSLNFNMYKSKNSREESYASSFGFNYNSRVGLQSMTLSLSTGINAPEKSKDRKAQDYLARFSNTSSSTISFAGDNYTPVIDVPTKNLSLSFSLSLGGQIQIGYLGGGITGFQSRQQIAQKTHEKPAYGFMHSEKARDQSKHALMDFNREKDIPYSPEVPYLAIPVPTNDFFSVTSQQGGGQYRLYRNSPGIFFDRESKNTSISPTLGIKLGFGTYFSIGADLYVQDVSSTVQKWKDRNGFLDSKNGDFQGYSSANPTAEPVYFKRVGEPVPLETAYRDKLLQTGPVAVALQKARTFQMEGPASESKFLTSNNVVTTISAPIVKDKREVRNNNLSHLTAQEAGNHGLEKKIKSYNEGTLPVSGCDSIQYDSIARVGAYRKKHHISEITVLSEQGNRMVYGIPVYNTYQEEVSFSVDGDSSKRKSGIIDYSSQDNSLSNNKGKEAYYNRQILPAYTTSFLLTGILSPDYVDRTKNGISEDDLGTAVKFNYTKLPNEYHWRTPHQKANYNEGFLSDKRDDKANYVYGKKEIWYVHSIESKTMIAQFITADRSDGLGVTGPNGGVNTANKLKKLVEIRLFSKSDLRANNNNPALTTPVKVVHFDYEQDNRTLGKEFPNSLNNSGKLTLKRVYFTYGKNNKGRLNPYEFVYDRNPQLDSVFQHREYDRWGNYKPASSNPNGLNNSEFPYTIQDSALTASFLSRWQLKKIVLPSGGEIEIDYESDDYAYVQDRRAMQMCFVKGVGNTAGQSSGLIDADRLLINLPVPVSNLAQMKQRYFEGVKDLYFRFYMDMDNNDAERHYEFVPGYAIIKDVEYVNSTTARIIVEKNNGYNPMSKAGWQFLKMNLPKYAYPGSENIDENSTDARKILSALFTAVKNIGEMFSNFDKRAKKRSFCNSIDLSKSWVRLNSPTYKKLGGGLRVKRVKISDMWSEMSQVTGAKTAAYTQLYDYTTTTKDSDGKDISISSGVATYEPMIGNDENPFRQPVQYKQKVVLGLDNFYYIEQPVGESFFPGPAVGYSKITVRSVGANEEEAINRTGTVVNEFYTARDFPTRVDNTGIQRMQESPGLGILGKLLAIVGTVSIKHRAVSQGYAVELNDMHGKQKSTKVYNRSGELISSVAYTYKTKNSYSVRKQLSNKVNVINPNGQVSEGYIGQEIEMYTDMREHKANSIGTMAKISGGSGAILIFPVPFFFPGIGANYERKMYRSSSTIKIIQNFAILEKVTKMENGSTITTENLLWDAVTGNVLETKVHNEFKDPVYNFTYPAHWAYDGMGQAYHNLGTFFQSFSSNSSGEVVNVTYKNMLVSGDELISTATGTKMWVIRSLSGDLRVIDESGQFVAVTNLDVKVLRSGRRNMANSAIATITSLKDPVVSNQLSVSQLTKILDAKAIVFSEEWSVPLTSTPLSGGEPDSCISQACMMHFLEAGLSTNISDNAKSYSKQALFAHQGDQATAGSILQNYYSSNNSNTFDSSCIDGFKDELNAYAFSYYLSTKKTDSIVGLKGKYYQPYFNAGDTAMLGYCKIIFDTATSSMSTIKTKFTQSDLPFGHIYSSVGAAPDSFGTVCVSDRHFYVLENTGCSYVLKRYSFDVLQQGATYYRTNTSYTGEALKFDLVCTSPLYTGCFDRVGDTINPYYTGILGNWRPWQTFAFHSDRSNGAPPSGKTDIRNAGYYLNYYSFWNFSGQQLTATTDFSRWVWSSYVTYYNSKGMEVENRDALNRYSSAQFGYLESLPVAVASNARYREIGYDNFEDYLFKLDCGTTDTCNSAGHFSFRNAINENTVQLDQTNVHSGKYSLKLTGPASISKKVTDTESTEPLFKLSSTGTYLLNRNDLKRGFSPTPGKKYVLSMWVKDESPRNATTNFQVNMNGFSLIDAQQKWKIVEGWKRIELVFTAPQGYMTLELNPGGTAYVDDIRIHPFDGQMKTYAYDPSSQRLMAELDENNFTTFYEYDDEGVLIRVKKETERGIMTIKETRSSYKPKPVY
jgi:hypothetical protein